MSSYSIFCVYISNFQTFVTMATMFDLSHFLLAQLKRSTQKTPHRERITYTLSPLQAVLWPILCLNLSLFVTVSTRVGLANDK